jgi:hypothetical protein
MQYAWNKVNIYKIVAESLVERTRWETQSTALKWIMNSNAFPQYSIHHKEIVKLLLARTLKQLILAYGIYGGPSDIGAGFLSVLRLSFPILISRLQSRY